MQKLITSYLNWLKMLLILIVCSMWQLVCSGSVKTHVTLVENTNVDPIDTSSVMHHQTVDSLMICALLCQKTSEWSFNYDSINKHCYCHESISANENFGGGYDVLSGSPKYARITSDEGDAYIRTYPLYADCLELYRQNFFEETYYEINLALGPRVVWCTEGWTFIQRRMDGSVDFNRPWQEYVDGFGDPYGEYWIGLENIRVLTSSSSTLAIKLVPFANSIPNEESVVFYSTFGLGPVHDEYRLTISGYTGGCGDSMSYHNGAQFSTYDVDNDIDASRHCADQGQAGWWHVDCYASNLNGPYRHTSDVDVTIDAGITWEACWGYDVSLSYVAMAVKRNKNAETSRAA